MVWAFDLGKGSIGEAVRRGNEFLHKASLLIPAEFAETKTAAGRRRMWRTRQAHSSHRPSPAGGGILVAANGKEAPCRSSAAVPGCGCGRRLAASSNTGRDARPTRRRDACATRFTQDHAAPTALGRIELKMPNKILDSVRKWANSENQSENHGFKFMPNNLSAVDGLPVRISGEGRERKHHYLKNYCGITTVSMRKKFKLVYLDVMAGPGRCKIEETNEEFPGSPLVALDHDFAEYIFIEEEPELVERLETTHRQPSQSRQNQNHSRKLD